jgi:probable rRNA maturation factor
MKLSIAVEDESWHGIFGVEGVVTRAVEAASPADSRSLDILLTSDAEIQTLNKQWRGLDKSTNVLSFPSPRMPVPDGEVAHLGDIVLAWGTVAQEARDAGKPLADHLMHLVVHGTLHLLGFDHENDLDAETMEDKEKVILAGLGLANPYAA